MKDAVMPGNWWELLVHDLADGWSFAFKRIDTQSRTIFVLAANRYGIDYIIISDNLLPAVWELQRQARLVSASA